ncbi:unnamed protein product [Mytilus coruscus]|uniref:Uncharacterized protein n=1 Tax=Mytilus coruscus TaxID=42192 RepID=A0A6J8BKD3_MYTCO|nr:unnamed protein product [Mytilus coruscus]
MWRWTDDCKKAFKKAKELITSDQVLIHYNPELPVRLACDASPFGLGAVLSHVMPDGSERPISFASRSLTKSEKNYAHTQKEALGIVWGVKKFNPFLYVNKSKESCDVFKKIANFLLTYRQTPHTSTHETPSKLYLGRDLRSRLHLLKQNLRNTVKKSQQKSCEIRMNKKDRQFEVGERVIAKDYRGKDPWAVLAPDTRSQHTIPSASDTTCKTTTSDHDTIKKRQQPQAEHDYCQEKHYNSKRQKSSSTKHHSSSIPSISDHNHSYFSGAITDKSCLNIPSSVICYINETHITDQLSFSTSEITALIKHLSTGNLTVFVEKLLSIPNIYQLIVVNLVKHEKATAASMGHTKKGFVSVLMQKDLKTKMEKFNWNDIVNEFLHKFPTVFKLIIGIMLPESEIYKQLNSCLPRIGILYSLILPARHPGLKSESINNLKFLEGLDNYAPQKAWQDASPVDFMTTSKEQDEMKLPYIQMICKVISRFIPSLSFMGEVVPQIMKEDHSKLLTEEASVITITLSDGKTVEIQIQKYAKKSKNVEKTDGILNYATLVLNLGLLYKELLSVCKLPDRKRLIRLMKQCLIVFKAKSNLSKYALEVLRFLVQQTVLLSEKSATMTVYSMFVNTQGKIDSHIPADFQMEYIVK